MWKKDCSCLPGERCEDRGRTYQDNCANQCPRSCTDLWEHVQCLQGACHAGKLWRLTWTVDSSKNRKLSFPHQSAKYLCYFSFFFLRLSVSHGTAAAGRSLCANHRVSLWYPIRQRDTGVPPHRRGYHGLQHLVRNRSGWKGNVTITMTL